MNHATISNPKQNLIVIVGPTAVGKTALAISLASELNAEILSADSRQVYKELNIGTAKPSTSELKQVPHHFINSHSIKDRFTVHDFVRESHEVLSKIYEHNNIAFLVGGSGLYTDALVNGLDDLPDMDSEVRKSLLDLLEKEGVEHLFERLSQLDPKYAEVVDENNPRRVIRALEVTIATGKPFSSFLGKSSNKPDYHVCKVGLDIPREAVYKRINERVDEMVDKGLVEEARSLLEYCDLPSLKTVGYQELVAYFEGLISLDEAIEKIKRNTRHYAKRQLTWFKRDESIKWFQPADIDLIKAYINESVK